ncbi:MAG: histidine triad nucleotide-binding protein [Armatimonadetes bacterium]|nr:histidine triad nucleotide-binding protein [Armatimonadota bacterium]
MSDCVFCKMAAKEIVPQTVYEDKDILAFYDINPQSPAHILIIPRSHFENILAVGESEAGLLGRMLLAANRVAADKGFAEDGFRLVINCNAHGGQSVDHLHIHLLAGRQMKWPPG